MKVESVRTTTLYLSMTADEVELIQANSWSEIPSMPHDLVLYTALHPCPNSTVDGAPAEVIPCTGRPEVLARIQLRAECLSHLNLKGAGSGRLELHVPYEEIPTVNRNLVGPIVPLRG